jgi:hypothetical protein
MKKLLLLLTLTITLLLSASFDCKKAKTDIEKLICSDEELSQLDDELNEAYKKALAGINDKETLKKQQITWLNNVKKYCKGIFCIKLKYESRIFYLQPDGFNIIYSEDNKTCNWFANLLNNDLKQYKEINLSRHKEFNWVEWKQIQKEKTTLDDFSYIFSSYFDINNDGNEEGVFIWKHLYKDFTWVMNILYTTKEDGNSVEEYIPYKLENNSWTSKAGELLHLRLIDENNTIDNGFSVYRFTKPASDFFYKNIQYTDKILYRYIKQMGYSDFINPEPYPLKYNNNYYIAAFGSIDSLWAIDWEGFYSYKMLNNGNIVALAKYNPDNIKSDVCILVRANPNTEKYLRYN